MAGINFDELDDIEFNTFNDQDKKANFLNKRKKVIKGTSEEKTERIGLKFTPKYKQELEEYKKSLGVRTFNALLYKLIELGKETHIQELEKLIKKDLL
ncbi:hypothetical protein PJV92_11515 [Aliarcobacter butzleri]|uniref:Uncharacterized protein n=1 Tax=Aliarcobacter butzleri TaxID=28197 RepID=A0AAP4Q0L7_9BACT|nr:hypothetical protein [Aliarcobacter butzleri]MDN5051371.1 hypothetical protein [Aliarcobacter butzleri]MDN5074198.1 hypothetical protein [Aliarcobacter butzleri]MDN5115615.1 hypothetical protein [Aliarcobacter butzleri]MDN5133347.1 hypothetical protein [Aliarcobacter butzleri]